MGHRAEWACVAFLLGIVAHSIWRAYESFTTTALSVILALMVVGAWTWRQQPRFLLCWVFGAALVLGVWRFDASLPRQVDGVLPWHGTRTEFVGRVQSMTVSGKKTALVVDVQRVRSEFVFAPGAVVWVYTTSTGMVEGSKVVFVCTLRPPGLTPLNPVRRQFLARRGIWSECAATSVVDTQLAPRWWDMVSYLAQLRRGLTERIQGVLPPEEAELVSGILYGDQHLDATVKADVQRAGLMHLVAVSGSNVTIVVVVMAALLLSLGYTRRQTFWATSVALTLFVVFVGASASVLRAAIMGWLMLLGRELGCKVSPDRLLLVTALALCLWNPWFLCFDAGFALSFLAMWGLLTWTPFFEARLQILPAFFGIRETVATTLGATLMTAPYGAWVFGRMTLVGLVTNVLALPLVPWTMLWGAVAAAWGNGWLARFIRLPAYGLAHLILDIARLSRYMTWLDLQIRGLDIWSLITCYGLLWWLWRVLNKHD